MPICSSRWRRLLKALIDTAEYLPLYTAFVVLVVPIESAPFAYRMQRTGLIERHLTSTIIRASKMSPGRRCPG